MHFSTERAFNLKSLLGLVLLFVATAHSQASLELNGLAVHEELGQPLFIGALYSETAHANAEQLLRDKGERHIELRVIAPRLSHRRLNKLWVEGAAVNSSRDTLITHARNMARFTGMIKRPLKSGDKLVLVSIYGDGTEVRLNGTSFGHIKHPDFFNLMLKTWIGRVPLSSKYRDQLLNSQEIDPSLLGQFETTQASPERQEEVAAWVRQPKHKPEINESDLKVAATPNITPVVIELESTPLLDTAATSNSADKVASEKAPEKAAQAEPKEPIAPQQVAQNARKLPSPPQVSDELEEAQAAEILLSRQLYQSELMRWTYKYVRYPSRAVERGQEGSVRVKVTIDREGQITDITELETSRYSLLNKAAMRSVERASPFPPVPEGISDEQFEFTLPIVFRLQ